MARKVFFSFHYKPDHWRASQVRQKGAIEGEAPVSDDDWEKVTKGGDPAIEKWIDGQISGKSCAVVLLGADTAGRKWIEHGICKARNEKKAYLEFTSTNSRITTRSSQRRPPPFDLITFGTNRSKLSTVVQAYDPPYSDSTEVYAYTRKHLSDWVEDAITTRAAN